MVRDIILAYGLHICACGANPVELSGSNFDLAIDASINCAVFLYDGDLKSKSSPGDLGKIPQEQWPLYDMWGQVAEAFQELRDDMLVAQLQTQQYTELLKGFRLPVTPGPPAILFRGARSEEWQEYKESTVTNEVIEWLAGQRAKGMNIEDDEDGRVLEFDEFASDMIAAATASEMEEVVELLRREMQYMVAGDDDQPAAKIYMSMMQKSLKAAKMGEAEGLGAQAAAAKWLRSEFARLRNLSQSKAVSKEKREALKRRRNIAYSFLHDLDHPNPGGVTDSINLGTKDEQLASNTFKTDENNAKNKVPIGGAQEQATEKVIVDYGGQQASKMSAYPI